MLSSQSRANQVTGNADDDYKLQIKQILATLSNAPSKVSAIGIRKLASKHNFEVFEDTLEGDIKRLSLGGTIVLLDIDFKDNKVVNVTVSIACAVKPSDESHSFLSTEAAVDPSASQTVLSALQGTRLDKFSNILAFLSKADKLSASVDCFRVLDEISHALFLVHDAQRPSELDYSSGYGRPVLNPENNVGLGIWYWTRQRYVYSTNQKLFAHLTFREISKNTSSTKYPVIYSQNWLEDPSIPRWNSPEPLDDARAEMVIILDPPVQIPVHLAEKLNAVQTNVSSSSDILLNQQWGQRKTSIYVPNSSTPTRVNFSFANILPYLFVEVDQIPLKHPKDLSEILDWLRKYYLLATVWESIYTAEDQAAANLPRRFGSDELETGDLSVIDYLMEADDSNGKGHTNTNGNQSSPLTPNNLNVSLNLLEDASGDIQISMKVLGAHDEHLLLAPTVNTETKQMAMYTQTRDQRLQQALPELSKAINVTEDLRVLTCVVTKFAKA